ncbi:MAG: TRAP transporter substrate-binding protein [Oscillospiraceae bacterium]
MKKFVAILLVAVMVFSLCACSRGGNDNGDDSEKAGEYELVIGHVYSEDSLEHAQMLKIKELVEAKTDGACKVTIYANEQLGDEQSIAEQCVTGACDMGFSEGSVWATVTNKPEFAVFGLPFQYNGIEAAQKVTEELIKPELNKIADGTGLYVLGNVYSGFRHILTVNKPIHTLADLKGMKIRVPNATVYVDMFKCMGANPTTTAFSETYQALQQGVVEGCECDLANIVQQNWQEVNNYMSYSYHLAAMNVICINQDKWESYPAEIQQAIQEAVTESEAYCFELRADADVEYIKAIEDANVEIYTLPEEELAAMKAACQPIYDEFIGYGLGDLLDSIAECSK